MNKKEETDTLIDMILENENGFEISITLNNGNRYNTRINGNWFSMTPIDVEFDDNPHVCELEYALVKELAYAEVDRMTKLKA